MACDVYHIVLGSKDFHMQVNRTQQKQAKTLVLHGKATSNYYPDSAWYAWNDQKMTPTQVNQKKDRVKYEVGFPSVFQTSEHLRFSLVGRPNAVLLSKKKRLGIGHTTQLGKDQYSHVWSVYYLRISQGFTPAHGCGQSTLKYQC